MVECRFGYGNNRVELESNVVYPLESLPYKRRTSTRVEIIGKKGDSLSLVCNINFSRTCRDGRRMRDGCCADYFYVGYNLDENIQRAERFCGEREIKRNSRKTSGRPVLVVGMARIFFSNS